MRTFQDMRGEEALTYGVSLLCRSTLAGEDPALGGLLRMFLSLLERDLPAAVRAYHDVTARLIKSEARRVSGDLWVDYLLHLVVHGEYPFARMAAAGQAEEALQVHFKEELSLLGALSRLRSQDVARFTREAQQALSLRPHTGKDAISAAATALWGGNSAPSRPREEEPEPPAPSPFSRAPFAFTPWHYGEPGLPDSFAADEALEEVYLRLLSAGDWGDLAQDLYNFFASYGTGPFLAHRAFRLEEGQLLPLPTAALAPLVPTSLYEGERVALMENTIRFMRGEKAQNGLLYGGRGTGKTAHVLTLLHELPEARLVLVNRGASSQALRALLERLQGQPLRFLVLLDDGAEKDLYSLSALVCGGRLQPENVLFYATAQEALAPPLFTLRLAFPYPSLSDFTRLVRELMEAAGLRPDPQAIHAACVDYQVDARDRLTFQGAEMLAEAYK